MKRLHPSIHLLKAFTATARFASVSQAAESLHLTQSAVSKQIGELEQLTGVALFERVRKRLILTPAGSRYNSAIQPVLAQLEAATLELITSSDGGGALHLSTLPTFGAKCLIPRLPAFQQAFSHIALHFVPYVQAYDFSRPDLDCSILFGTGNWPGAMASYITGRDVVLIAPPPGRDGPQLERPEDLANFTLLHHISVPQAWAAWCDTHSVRGINARAGPQLDQYHSMIRAVMAGMGLALVPLCLVSDDIAAGLVAAPLDDHYQADTGYYLCFPESRRHLAPLVSFHDWLIESFA